MTPVIVAQVSWGYIILIIAHLCAVLELLLQSSSALSVQFELNAVSVKRLYLLLQSAKTPTTRPPGFHNSLS